ncbi:TetR/AcrR family transcriptional regulator [Streptomyces sp. NPDC048172]|uniref:TetR/AcrR family transcriptional regulator n=1 Tax=Streptomyces sp. NPDC048172 TaxID=3365505 RepID=UPI00371137F4
MTTDSADSADGPDNEGLARLKRSLDLLWSGGERPRPARGPKPGLTLERIVVTAIDLANREGLGALSMRKVAGELGVGTMSLYRYVPGKGELIDLMVDHVNGPVEELEESRGLGWRATMEFIAESSWTLYTTNSWILQVNQARPILGPNSMAGFEYALEALEGLGLSGQEQVGLLVAIDNLVTGAARSHVLYQQAAQQSGVTDEEFWNTQGPYVERAMRDGAFPLMEALPEDSFAATGEQLMRFGLGALLDGFAALIASRAGRDGAAPATGPEPPRR